MPDKAELVQKIVDEFNSQAGVFGNDVRVHHTGDVWLSGHFDLEDLAERILGYPNHS